MSESDKKDAADSSSSVNGVSQFLGKVLNQLSLTSWMPAGMLVGVGALLFALHAQIASKPGNGFDLGGAVAMLTTHALGTAVVLLVAVILAASVTQAFSFGTIRLLEGYWSGRGASGVCLRLRAAHWLKRRKQIEERKKAQEQAAFEGAISAMRKTGIAPAWIAVIEDKRKRTVNFEALYTPDTVRDALAIDWREFAPSGLLNAVELSEQQFSEFPAPHRVLPTKLGNVLRSREDALEDDGYDLEGFVMRRYGSLDPELLAQHDEFKGRLEMYCTFVPVFAMLAVLAAALLSWPGGQYIVAIVTAVGLVVLSILSYRAAIASARGYGSVLEAMSAAASETDSVA